ncbi:MAG TPA: hypothetical protein GXZ43_03850 [Clostridiaceae bacterium]|nr:hypothetical protein [Clostridiaceae bacterium]
MYDFLLSQEERVIFDDEIWLDKVSNDNKIYNCGVPIEFGITSNLQIQAKINDKIIGLLSEGVMYMVLLGFLFDPTIRLTAEVADHTTFQLEHAPDFKINVVAFERSPLKTLPDGATFVSHERLYISIDTNLAKKVSNGEKILVIPEGNQLNLLTYSGEWIGITENIFEDKLPEKTQEYIRYYGYLIYKDNEVVYAPTLTNYELEAVNGLLLVYMFENEHPLKHPDVSSVKPITVHKNNLTPVITHTLNFEDYQTQLISADFETIYPDLKSLTLGGIAPWKEMMRFKSDALYMDAMGRVLRAYMPFSVSYWFRLYSSTRLVKKDNNILAIAQTPVKQTDGLYSSLCEGSEKNGYLIWQVPSDVADPIEWINNNKDKGVFLSSDEEIESKSDNSTLYSINDERSKKSYAGLGKCEYFKPFSPGMDSFDGLCCVGEERNKVDSEYGFSICMDRRASGLCLYKKTGG